MSGVWLLLDRDGCLQKCSSFICSLPQDSHFVYSFSPVAGLNKMFIRLTEAPSAKVRILSLPSSVTAWVFLQVFRIVVFLPRSEMGSTLLMSMVHSRRECSVL